MDELISRLVVNFPKLDSVASLRTPSSKEDESIEIVFIFFTTPLLSIPLKAFFKLDGLQSS